jgi:hypothetical protein
LDFFYLKYIYLCNSVLKIKLQMAINWNQAEYVAPRLQIVPEQLPVEAGVKVGAVLQDRFDKSYENLTKSEEALRQMALNANEVDRPEVERIYNQYSEQLKGIDKTDLHNARWKTLKLATEAANNYMSVAQRNKEIQAQKEMISKNPIYQFSKEARLKAFKKGLPSIGWDAEKRTFTNLNVTPYAGAADVNIAEVAAKASSMMKPTDFGSDVEKITYYDAENKVTTDPMKAFRAVTTDTSKRTKTLTPEEIRSAVGKYLSADAGVNAMLNRDYSENLQLTGDPEKDELIKQQYRESLINPALDAAGALFRINDSVTGNKIREGTGLGLELAKAGAKNAEENRTTTYFSDYFNPQNKAKFDGEFDEQGNLKTSKYGSDSKATKTTTQMLDFMVKINPNSPIATLRKVFPMITHNIAEVAVRTADIFDESIVPDDIQKTSLEQSFIYDQAKASVENSESGSKLTGQAKLNAINNVAKQYKDAEISLPLNIYSNPEKIKNQTNAMFPSGPKNEYFNTGTGRFAVAVNPETGKKYVGSGEAGEASFYNEVLSKAKDVQVVGEVKAGNPIFKGYPGYVLNVDGTPYYVSSELEKQKKEEAVIESLVDLERYPLMTAKIGPDNIPAKIVTDAGGQYYHVLHNGEEITEYITENTPVGKYTAALNIYDRIYGTK